MTSTGIIIVVAVAVIVAFILISYVKAPPSHAYIISGLKKEPKVLIGKGGFKIPYLERLDKVFLGQVTVDVKTNRSVPTNDFINVNVDAVSKVRVIPTPDGIRLAAKNFLNMHENMISEQVKDSLEGNMREVVGALTLTAINTDRDKFSDQIASKAAPDMAKLGLEIISCNIQNVTDENGLIKDLGADNTYAIKKNAALTKVNTEKEIAIAQAEAEQAANEAQVQSQTEIAIRQNQLAIKRSELKVQEDINKATADAAYRIQEQEQLKTIKQKSVEAEATEKILIQEKQREINAKQVEAEIEKAKKQEELTSQQIKIQANKLDAEVKKQADADKYNIEIQAEAVLERKKREAEAAAYLAEQEAAATIAKAKAKKEAMVLEAEAVKKQGEAEAYRIACAGKAEAEAIKAKGEAEAAAMEKKADAYKQYGQAAILDMMVKIIPEVSKNVAEPLSAIDNLNIYGSGSEVSEVSGNVPAVIKQTFDTVESVTGVNLSGILKNSEINAASIDLKK